MISCGYRDTRLDKSTQVNAGDHVDYQHRNRN